MSHEHILDEKNIQLTLLQLFFNLFVLSNSETIVSLRQIVGTSPYDI